MNLTIKRCGNIIILWRLKSFLAILMPICSVCIRIARDMFALLPVARTIVHAVLSSNTVISVDFDRINLSKFKFEYIDPSDTLSLFRHNMNYNDGSDFAPVAHLE